MLTDFYRISHIECMQHFLKFERSFRANLTYFNSLPSHFLNISVRFWCDFRNTESKGNFLLWPFCEQQVKYDRYSTFNVVSVFIETAFDLLPSEFVGFLLDPLIWFWFDQLERLDCAHFIFIISIADSVSIKRIQSICD